MTVPPGTTEPCAALNPGCPESRPDNARVLLMLATCSYANGAGACSPIPSPLCPRKASMSGRFTVINPKVPGSICAGEVAFRLEPKPNGGATLSWSAQEMETLATGACRPVGQEFTGTADVAGPCCEGVTEVPFERGGFTFRIVARTDWER